MATIRKRGDSYQIIVSCGYDSNHKQILKRKTYRPELLTKKGKPRTAEAIAADVKKAAADFEARVLHGEAVAGDNMTFEVLAQKYLQECAERTQAPTTLKSTKTAVDQFIDDFGYIKVSNITPMFLQEYVNGLLDAKRQDKRPGTISPKTVKRKIAVLSAIFSQAIKWDIVKYNPVRAVSISEKEKPTETDIQCFTQQQAVSFLQALDNPMMYEYTQHNRTAKTGNVTQIRSYQAEHTLNNQLKLFLNLAIYTGCRRGDDDDKIRLNQRKPSKYKGLRRFGPEKNLQRINKFMKERPIFYKNLIQMKENIRFYLRCFYCITKVMILQFNSENRTELARNG